MNIEQFYQPSGNSCGPTCLFMVKEYLFNHTDSAERTLEKNNFIIDEISELCGTDWVVGTPPDRMIKGMNCLGMKFVEYQSSPRPFQLLRTVIENNNIPILRTITKGVPHWIIVTGYIGFDFQINDPWQGKIIYSEKELNDIWECRQYQFFELIDSRIEIC